MPKNSHSANRTLIKQRLQPNKLRLFVYFSSFFIAFLANVQEIESFSSEKSNVSVNLSVFKEVEAIKVKNEDESNGAIHENSSLLVRFGSIRSKQGFFAALSLIVGTELGDKTFFIAAIMSMKHNRLTVFVSAISALVLMTLLSVGLGYTSNLIPKSLTHYLSVLLFFGFGIKMIYDGYSMTEQEAKEEFEEVNKKIAKRECVKTADIEYNLVSNEKQLSGNLGTGVLRTIITVPLTTRLKRWLLVYISLTFVETFVMTFVAEWGDRSQVATIALAANHEIITVTLGAIFGHSLCTGLAVIGGRLIAQRISVKTVTIIGGFIFIFFAVLALVMRMHSETKSNIFKSNN